MKFIITPTEKKTKVINIGIIPILLKLKPFLSDIKGLLFCYDNINGYMGKEPINDTSNQFIIEVNGGDVWFEYHSSNKVYELELFI